MSVFWGVSTLKHYRSLSRPSKGTSLRETASYISHHALKLVQSFLLQATTRKKERKGKVQKVTKSLYILRNRREAPCERILTKFRTSRDMADVIICAKFVVEKLRGQRYTGCKLWCLPLKRLVTLTTVLRYRATCDQARQQCKRRSMFVTERHNNNNNISCAYKMM